MMWWYGGPGFGGWSGYGWGWGGGWIMMIIGIVGFLFLIWGIITIIRWSTIGSWSSHYHRGHYRRYYRGNNDDAISALKMRYARGEITKEEYERILKDLMN